MNRVRILIIGMIVLLSTTSSNAQDVNTFWEQYVSLINENKHAEILQFTNSNKTLFEGDVDKFLFDIIQAISYKQLSKDVLCKQHLHSAYKSFNKFDKETIKVLQSNEAINLFTARYYFLMAQYYLSDNQFGEAELYLSDCFQTLYNRSDREQSGLYRDVHFLFGMLYNRLFDYARATRYFEDVKIASEANLWFDNTYCSALTNLGSIFIRKKEFLKARIYLGEASYTFSEFPIQNENPKSYEVRCLLSLCYAQMGYFDEARKIAIEGVRDCQKYGLKDKPLYLMYYSLGCTNLLMKDYISAKSFFKKGASICAKDKTMTEFEKLTIHCDLAITKYLTNDSKCSNMLTSLSNVVVDDVIEQFSFMSNEERARYWDNTNDYLSKFNSMLFQLNRQNCFGQIYNNTLFSKGLLLRTTNHITEALIKSENDNMRLLVNVLQQLNNNLLRDSITSDRLIEVKDSIRNIEKQLSRELIGYQSPDSIKRQYSWESIKESLSSGEAAIEFILLPELNIDSSQYKEDYAAMIIRKDSKYPNIVFLCSEDSLSYLKEVPHFLDNTGSFNNQLFHQYLYGLGEYNHRRVGKKALKLNCIGDRLSNLIWNPLEQSLNGIRTIYYSPVGMLNAISFNAISIDNTLLSEKYVLRRVSSTSEIHSIKNKNSSLIHSATIYGGIDYNTSDDEMIAKARGYGRCIQVRNFDSNDRGNTERSSWGVLPGSSVEAKEIATKLSNLSIQNKLLIESEANEESFKTQSGQSSSILHLATHGFFYSNENKDGMANFLQGIQGLPNMSYIQEAMNRSGILLSGANKAWGGSPPPKEIEDGILTADEISRLDLSNTDIVILSACETGLGEVISTEGVFGLQRAFKLAGVKTIVMSLWKVPDSETSQLMQLFYDNWLSGMEKYEAFIKAQEAIRKDRSNPYFWAGFVMLD